MARPKRDTVDYFTHDCDASGRKTLKIMRGQFGLIGVGFWWTLLEYLGHSEGHVLDVRDPSNLEFLLRELGTDVVSGTEMLGKLAFLGAIDKVLWQHKVIWSQNFVDRLADVYKKRVRPLPPKPCFCDGNCNHPIIEPDISGAESRNSMTEIPHSIVKDSIVKEIILDNTILKETKEVSSISQINRNNLDVLDAFRKNILLDDQATIPEELEKELNTACERYSSEWVIDAIREAAARKHPNLSYINGILRNRAAEVRKAAQPSSKHQARWDLTPGEVARINQENAERLAKFQAMRTEFPVKEAQ